MPWDLALFNAIHRFWGTSRVLDAVGLFFADILTYFLAAATIIFIFLVGHIGAQYLFITGEILLAFLVSRGAVTSAIAYFVRRERPFVALGFKPGFKPITASAFPSGHMAGLFSIAFVMFAFDARWGAVFMALSLLVGLARIFTGVHWPSDILAGILIGIGSAWATHALLTPSRQALFALTGPSSAGSV